MEYEANRTYLFLTAYFQVFKLCSGHIYSVYPGPDLEM